MVEVYNAANQDDYDVMPQMLSVLGIDNTQSIYISQTKKIPVLAELLLKLDVLLVTAPISI